MRNCDDKFTYVQHMLAEHRRLDALLRGTLATFPSWEEVEPAEWRPRFVKRMRMIRDELIHHFRDEEEGGCMEEAVSRCPALAGDWRQVEAEHGELLQRLDDLIHRGESEHPRTQDSAAALWQDFWKLVRDLRSHEARENRILQHGFSVALEEFAPEATLMD